MFWFLYNCLFLVGYSLLLPKFLLRMLKRGGYRRGFLERFARYRSETERQLGERPRIWIHAVSVGEIHVATSFMRELRARDASLAFILTTTTSTGHRLAERSVTPADVLLYFPMDFPPVMRRFLNLTRPSMVVLTEAEIWPNLIRMADARCIPVVIVNARVSASSYRGYSFIRPIMRRLLPRIRLALAQTEVDASRLRDLGCCEAAVAVVGSAKFDLIVSGSGLADAAVGALAALQIPREAPLLVGGSTWVGEEAVLLDMFRRLREQAPGLRLILVPRHAERAAEVGKTIAAAGLRFIRLTEARTPGRPAESPEVLLVDTTGELLGFYAVASCVFVGKSLLHHGGQNPIEPASLGRAVLVGPHMENFDGVMREFLSEDALIQVSDADALEAAMRDLLQHPDKREAYGVRARAVVMRQRGAVRRSVDWMLPLLPEPVARG